MPIVSVDQAAPGMVLSEAVTDRRGRLLIPAGQALSDKHVNALKMWGVASLSIEGDEPAEAAPSISSEALEAARGALAAPYRHTDLSHPFVAKLFEHAAQRYAETVNAPPAPEAPEAAVPAGAGVSSE